MFTNMAFIDAFSWYAVNQVFTNPLSTLVPCIITESVLVFLPLVYLALYFLWYATERCQEGAKTKMKVWYNRTLFSRISRIEVDNDTDLLIESHDDLRKYGDLMAAPVQ